MYYLHQMKGAASRMRILYCVPGLGADERLFERTRLTNTIGRPISWLKPEKDETLTDYAQRLCAQIDQSQPFSLLGVSFRGVMAVEMSRFVTPEQIILVSSFKRHDELPWYFRLAGCLKLHSLVPDFVVRHSGVLAAWFLGARSSEDRDLLRRMQQSLDIDLFRWSLDQALKWPGGIMSPNTSLIHGSADRLLPRSNVDPGMIIEGGGHLMIFNRADEINVLLDNLVSQYHN
jgi:hypothetical protein